jgi:hypothetical protein
MATESFIVFLRLVLWVVPALIVVAGLVSGLLIGGQVPDDGTARAKSPRVWLRRRKRKTDEDRPASRGESTHASGPRKFSDKPAMQGLPPNYVADLTQRAQ